MELYWSPRVSKSRPVKFCWKLTPSEIEAQLNQARERFAAASASLERAQAPFVDRLKTAQSDLEKARLAASTGRSLDEAVAAARANLERTEADLARLTEPPADVDVRAAETAVAAARLALQQAEATLAKLKNGPDPAQLRAAETQAAQTENLLAKEQAVLDALVRGPDPYQLQAAEREVQLAEANLRALEDSKGSKDNRSARDAAILAAEIRLQDAAAKLAKLKEPTPPWQIEVARRNVAVAQMTLTDARERLETVRRGPDQLALDAATIAVTRERTALEKAEAGLQKLQAGPPADQVALASRAAERARAALADAAARATDQKALQQLTTSQTTADAEGRIASLTALLDGSAPELASPPDATAGRDLAVLIQAHRVAATEQARVEALERNLGNTRLVAPVAGVVSRILAGTGESVAAGSPAALIAKTADFAIRARLTERDAARVAAGQPAIFQLQGPSEQKLNGSVASIVETTTGRDLVVQFGQPATPPTLGAAGQLLVTLQHKSDALLVPQRAIRTVGGRRFVDILEGTSQRRVEVEVGITSDNEAEVLSGLRTGQLVLVGL